MILIASDLLLVPWMCLFLILCLRMDMMSLSHQLENVNRSKRIGNPHQIWEMYNQLTAEVTMMKSFLTHALSIFTFCSTPFICTVIYSTSFMDNAFFVIAIASIGLAIMIQEFTILALASNVNSLSDRLHHLLCTINGRHKDSLSVRERRQLLQMMEEMGSEERLLSLQTLDGQTYSTETFFVFVLDTGINYTLLVTFGYLFKTI